MVQTTRVGAVSVIGIDHTEISSQLVAPPPQLSLLHATTSCTLPRPSPVEEDRDRQKLALKQRPHHHHSPAGLHGHTCQSHHIHSDVNNIVVFPSFLPPQVKHLRDSAARAMALRIERLPVQTSFLEKPIMTSCVKPKKFRKDQCPVLLLHGFDSSCLEWSKTYPKLERHNLECWAVDILGWGFSCSEGLKSAGVAEKREHLYQFWQSYIQKPVILVGPSLGGAMAIDFCLAHPEAVSKLILINAQGYAEGTGRLAVLPKLLAYAGVTKETLVIWGEQDRIISKDVPQRLRKDLPDVRLEYVKYCGHLPHVEKPDEVRRLIVEFCKT